MSRKSSRRQAAATVEPPEPPIPVTRSHDVVKDENGEEMSADKVAELWAEFAGDHYEIVEQLPLELHRNSRLLRELDAESLSQQERLQAKIREYIAYRVALVRPKTQGKALDVDAGTEIGDKQDDTETTAPRNETGERAGEDRKSRQSSPAPAVENTETTAAEDAPASDQATSHLDAPEDPSADGKSDTWGESWSKPAGVAVAVTAAPTEDGSAVKVTEMAVTSGTERDDLATATVDEPSTVTIEEPTTAQDVEPKMEPALTPASPPTPSRPEPLLEEDHAAEAVDAALDAPEAHDESLGADKPNTVATRTRRQKPFALGDISSLMSELVRNREEKVAIAVGAYNTIDRHIRALDSALSAQETSLLGLAGTEPPPEPVAPEPTPPRKSGRKDKRKRKSSELATPATVPGELPPGIEADPNEPRYCYCNQVSYGEMVGCDNDDCPYEWFHLSCLGLTAPPAGDFLCDACRPDKEHTAPQRKRRKR